MSRDWKPGDVALVTDHGGVEHVAVLVDRKDLEPLWIAGRQRWGRASEMPVRPLAVIDPESREQVERLAKALLHEVTKTLGLDTEDERFIAEALPAALREFAEPKPPKPEEPTGLGAVVEDAEGEWWVRFTSKSGAWWRNHQGENRHYADIDVVRALSEGWSE